MALRIPPAANGEEHGAGRFRRFQDRHFKRVLAVVQRAPGNLIPNLRHDVLPGTAMLIPGLSIAIDHHRQTNLALSAAGYPVASGLIPTRSCPAACS